MNPLYNASMLIRAMRKLDTEPKHLPIKCIGSFLSRRKAGRASGRPQGGRRRMRLRPGRRLRAKRAKIGIKLGTPCHSSSDLELLRFDKRV